MQGLEFFFEKKSYKFKNKIKWHVGKGSYAHGRQVTASRSPWWTSGARRVTVADQRSPGWGHSEGAAL